MSFVQYRQRWQRITFVYNSTKTTIRKKPFRYKVKMYKGPVYVVLSRQFANYSLTDNMAKELLEWLKDTRHPDETFFNTLIQNIPGDNPLSTVGNHLAIIAICKFSMHNQ